MLNIHELDETLKMYDSGNVKSNKKFGAMNIGKEMNNWD